MSEPTVTVYIKKPCPYCVRTTGLLYKNGIRYQEVDVTGKAQKLHDLFRQTGMQTLPQIFHGNQLIGGFDQLVALNEERGLGHLKIAQ